MKYLLLLSLLTSVLANPITTPNDSSIDRRNPISSDETITAYSDVRCSHASNTWKGKYYGQNQTWPSGFRSYSLSRDLYDYEQLDFSASQDSVNAGPQGLNGATVMDAGKKPDFCQVFTKKAIHPQDRSAGCHGVSPSAQCVNLWKTN
jgi:hypothetical protein